MAPFFSFTLKQYTELSEMFQTLQVTCTKVKDQMYLVLAFPLPDHSSSRSPGNLQPWNFTLWRLRLLKQDRLRWPAAGALCYPAPGKQAKWSLSRPLPMQASHQLLNSITDLAVSPPSAQHSMCMGRTSASWGTRWSWQDPCLGPQIYVVQQSPVPQDSKGSKPPLLAGVQVDDTPFLLAIKETLSTGSNYFNVFW